MSHEPSQKPGIADRLSVFVGGYSASELSFIAMLSLNRTPTQKKNFTHKEITKRSMVPYLCINTGLIGRLNARPEIGHLKGFIRFQREIPDLFVHGEGLT